MFTWFDTHTHRQSPPDTQVYALHNFHDHFDQAQQPCTLGLHPWYLHAPFPGTSELAQYAAEPQVKAIGECGLDKLAETPWSLQLDAFRFQLRLAISLQKPLLLHCVRAYNEVLQVLKEERVSVPVVFHGFNRGQVLAEQLWEAGYYLSFGAALLHKTGTAAGVWARAPADRVFLETDHSGKDIQCIYAAAAAIRKTDPNTVILQLQKNATTVFNL